jgi:hypothetical protein
LAVDDVEVVEVVEVEGFEVLMEPTRPLTE